MKISKIADNPLPGNVKQELHSLLRELNSRRTCEVRDYENYSEYKSRWIGWLGLKNDKGDIFARFKNCGLYSDCYTGDIGTNSQIVYKDRVYHVSNKKGKFRVTDGWYEPITEPLQKSAENIYKIVKQIKENFDNPDVVKKEWYSMRGLRDKKT